MGFLGDIGGMIFGSDDEVKTKQLSKLAPWQKELATEKLMPWLKKKDIGAREYEGQLSATPAALAETSLSGLEDYAKMIISGQGGIGAVNEFLGQLIAEPFGGEEGEKFWKEGYVDPLMEIFTEDTMPALHRAYAPDFFGSERREREMRAGEDLIDAIAGERGRYQGAALDRALEAAKLRTTTEALPGDILTNLYNVGMAETAREQEALTRKYNDFIRRGDEEARNLQLLMQALGISAIENVVNVQEGQPGFLSTFLGTEAGASSIVSGAKKLAGLFG